MARTVRDTLLMLTCLASGDPRDALAGVVDPLLSAQAPPADLSALRVACSPDLGGFAPIDPVIRRAFAQRIGALRGRFHSAADDAPPMEHADRVYEVLRAVSYVGTWGQRNREQPGRWGRLVGENMRDAARFTIDDIGDAYARHTRIYQAAQAFFTQYDLLILPTVAVSAWPKHDIYPAVIDGQRVTSYFDWVRITYAITLINHPCISIPCGVDERGIPFGLQLVAPRGRDVFLLQAAMALEDSMRDDPAMRRPVPDLGWLAAQAVEDPLATAVR
jgi:Asp-tRNA(Asn)/Glu-tRNA(Gln) amidotransferase A subunit family amidase